MNDPPIPQNDPEVQAGLFHDTHHGDDPRNGSCWCCCTACDPEYEGPTPNPFYVAAQLQLRST
jgi:hypothetical protein